VWAQAPASKRRFPIALAAGAAVVVLVGIGAVMMLKGRGGPEAPEPSAAAATPAADSGALRAADSAKAPTEAMGFVRISGDLPDDAILWLDTTQVTGRLLRVAPGRYTLEVETTEFQPWERRITVRVGDTVRVFVELELAEQDSTPSP
jgi:hypothetical protein